MFCMQTTWVLYWSNFNSLTCDPNMLLGYSEQGEISFSQDNGGWAGHALLGKLLH